MENNRLGIKIIGLADCVFGIFVLGWLFKASNSFISMFYAFLSGCPCSIVAKIAFAVVLLLIALFIKSGVQILKLDSKGRDDHINFSALGIFILLFPVLFTGKFSPTAVICGSLIVYLAWSIFYLNRPKVKELFN